jgi:hypothetical protein
MHLPVLALRSSRFSGFSSDLRLRVNGSQGEIAKYVAELIAQPILQLAHDGMSLKTVRTLEITVLNKNYRGLCWTLDVVMV